jgi:sugar (pentulose or hexulose) kinase
MAWPVRVVEPDLQGAKAYDVYYDVYRDLYPSLRETLRKLAAGAATAS